MNITISLSDSIIDSHLICTEDLLWNVCLWGQDFLLQGQKQVHNLNQLVFITLKLIVHNIQIIQRFTKILL